MRAALDSRSISSTWLRWRRSTVTTPRYVASTSHSTPPTTDDPPPYGIAAAPASAHQSRTSATSASVRGVATTSGGWPKSRRKARTTSRNDLPYVCPARSAGSVVHCDARDAGGSSRGSRSSSSSIVGGPATAISSSSNMPTSVLAICSCWSRVGPSPSYPQPQNLRTLAVFATAPRLMPGQVHDGGAAAMETKVDEIADGIYRLSTNVPEVAHGGFTFNQFVVKADEPLLFHCGPRQMFPLVSEAASEGHPSGV